MDEGALLFPESIYTVSPEETQDFLDALSRSDSDRSSQISPPWVPGEDVMPAENVVPGENSLQDEAAIANLRDELRELVPPIDVAKRVMRIEREIRAKALKRERQRRYDEKRRDLRIQQGLQVRRRPGRPRRPVSPAPTLPDTPPTPLPASTPPPPSPPPVRGVSLLSPLFPKIAAQRDSSRSRQGRRCPPSPLRKTASADEFLSALVPILPARVSARWNASTRAEERRDRANSAACVRRNLFQTSFTM